MAAKTSVTKTQAKKFENAYKRAFEESICDEMSQTARKDAQEYVDRNHKALMLMFESHFRAALKANTKKLVEEMVKNVYLTF